MDLLQSFLPLRAPLADLIGSTTHVIKGRPGPSAVKKRFKRGAFTVKVPWPSNLPVHPGELLESIYY